MPASLHQSVTKNQTTEILFCFCRCNSKKGTDRVASFFSNWDNENNKKETISVIWVWAFVFYPLDSRNTKKLKTKC